MNSKTDGQAVKTITEKCDEQTYNADALKRQTANTRGQTGSLTVTDTQSKLLSQATSDLSHSSDRPFSSI